MTTRHPEAPDPDRTEPAETGGAATEEEAGDEASRVQAVWRTRHRVHRVSLALRLLGWLAAVGCLLAGVAAVLLWAWQAIA